MLLLVPAQKANDEDGTGSTTDNNSSTDNNANQQLTSSSRFTPLTTDTTTHHSSSPSLISTSGRVLVVLPSHTDLTSKLTVSDSSLSGLTSTNSFLHSEHHSSASPLTASGHNGGSYSGMVKSFGPEFDSTTVTIGGLDTREYRHRRHSVQASGAISSSLSLSQHLSFVDSLLENANDGSDASGSLPFTNNDQDYSNNTSSRRRHSHLGLALGCGGMDPETIARLRYASSSSSSSSSSASGSNRSSPRPFGRSRSRSRRASRRTSIISSSLSTLTTPPPSSITASSNGVKMKLMRNGIATNILTATTRSIQEAFKKSMTVHSPLLTSTSSGMVLDLSPGPESNITVSNGKNSRGSTLAVAADGISGKTDRTAANGTKAAQLSPIEHKGKSSPPLPLSGVDCNVRKSKKRSQEEMMEDLDSSTVKSEPMDVTCPGDGSCNPLMSTITHRIHSSNNSNDLGGNLDAAATISKDLSVLDVGAAGTPPPSKKVVVSLGLPTLPSSSHSMTSPSSLPSPPSAPARTRRAQVGEQNGNDEDDDDNDDEYNSQDQERQGQRLLETAFMTAQDISAFMSTTMASMGIKGASLTPLEIQKRLYAHQEKQQLKLRKRRLHYLQQQQQQHEQQKGQFARGSVLPPAVSQHHYPNYHPLSLSRSPLANSSHPHTPTTTASASTCTTQRCREIVGANYNGTVDPHFRRTTPTATANPTMAMTTNLAGASFQQHNLHSQARLQTQQQHSLPLVMHPPALSTSSTPPSASLSHPLDSVHSQHYQQQQQQQLPSYYYLPPSAFRTTSAVAAEEKMEAAERKHKETAIATAAAIVDVVNADRDRERDREREMNVDEELEKEEARMKSTKEEEDEDEFLIFPSPTLS